MERELITAIVTGGASGIGESVVREIIRHGGSVGVIDLNIEKGKSLADEFKADIQKLLGPEEKKEIKVRKTKVKIKK